LRTIPLDPADERFGGAEGRELRERNEQTGLDKVVDKLAVEGEPADGPLDGRLSSPQQLRERVLVTGLGSP
jgi:hypothetical protein